MKFNLAELLNTKKTEHREEVNEYEQEEFTSLDNFRNFYNEFSGDSWEEKPELFADHNEDTFLQSIDEYDDEHWVTQNDPEKVRAMEYVIADDDETTRIDDWGLNEILGKEKYVKSEKVSAYLFPIGMDRFKRMRDAKKYHLLTQEFEKYKHLQPKRGDSLLSLDEIKKEVDNFHKKRSQKAKMSSDEYYFAKQCEAFLWAEEELAKIDIQKNRPLEYQKLGAIPELLPHEAGDDQGKPLTDKQIADLTHEYDAFKESHPKDFALMRLELVGEEKVASGEWKKQVFTWHPETHQGRQQWVCVIGNTKYVTSINPEVIAKNGEPANFYYTEGKSFPLKGRTLQFITIRTPEGDTKRSSTTTQKSTV